MYVHSFNVMKKNIQVLHLELTSYSDTVAVHDICWLTALAGHVFIYFFCVVMAECLTGDTFCGRNYHRSNCECFTRCSYICLSVCMSVNGFCQWAGVSKLARYRQEFGGGSWDQNETSVCRLTYVIMSSSLLSSHGSECEDVNGCPGEPIARWSVVIYISIYKVLTPCFFKWNYITCFIHALSYSYLIGCGHQHDDIICLNLFQNC